MEVIEYQQPGEELTLFADAVNWKAYWLDFIRDYVRGDVLEVGAGVGNNTGLLAALDVDRITCVEPDPALAAQLEARLQLSRTADRCRIVVGKAAALPAREQFDTIVYIDVLEHIEGDAAEMAIAANLLRAEGYLIVLAPAHNRLYTRFDTTVGHFRRYDRKSLDAVVPRALRRVKFAYLDSFGMIVSGANKLFLKQSMPTPTQLRFWDSVLVRASRVADRLLRFRVGKTVVGIWQKPPAFGEARA